MSKAAILGQQGGVWAKSAGYEVNGQPPGRDPSSSSNHIKHAQLSADEQNKIIGGHNDPSSMQASGIRAGGQKFFTIQANDRSIYGKK